MIHDLLSAVWGEARGKILAPCRGASLYLIKESGRACLARSQQREG